MQRAVELFLCCLVFWCATGLRYAASASPMLPSGETLETHAADELMADLETAPPRFPLPHLVVPEEALRSPHRERIIVEPDAPRRERPRQPLPDLLSGPPWPDCVTLSALTSDMSPLDVAEVTIACAEAGDYETMAMMMYFQDVLAWFDGQRLGMTYLRLANELRSRHITQEQERLARPHAERIRQAQTSEIAFHEEICAKLWEHGTPTYTADWAQPLLESSGTIATPPENTNDEELWDFVLTVPFDCPQE